MVRIVVGFVVLCLMAGQAMADVQLRLTARVEPSCAVVRVVPGTRASVGAIAVTTACNARQFSLAVSAAGRPIPMEAVFSEASDVSLDPGGTAVTVTPRSPGVQTIRIGLGTQIDPRQPLVLQIMPR